MVRLILILEDLRISINKSRIKLKGLNHRTNLINYKSLYLKFKSVNAVENICV